MSEPRTFMRVGVFSTDELDAVRGPWNRAHLDVMKSYLAEYHPGWWMERESFLAEQLASALEFIESGLEGG